MAILDVFGANLRLLSQKRSSLAKVAADLDINRIQFQRYLKGESFPKPNVLQRICDYFDVDARILTQPLTPDLAQHMRQRPTPPQQSHLFQSEWMHALNAIAPDQDYFSPPHFLEDGLYCIWRWAMSDVGKMVRVLLQVWTEDGVKFVRGYDHATIYKGSQFTARRREFRGICLKMGWGYTILFFHCNPSRTISSLYISPIQIENTRLAFTGIGIISRDETPNRRRMSRLIIEKIEGGRRQLVREAHKRVFYDPDELPHRIRSHIDLPMA